MDKRYLTEAKGILMLMHQLNECEAYDMLRAQAMAKRVSIDDICRSVIQAGEILQLKRSAKSIDGKEVD